MENLDQGLIAGEILSPLSRRSFGKISAKLTTLFDKTSEQPAAARIPVNLRRVAIIGGGYAGLAAAVELASRGIVSAVFEAGPTLGGRARRIQYQGIDLDNGAHVLLGAYRQTLRLMRLAGVAENSLWRLPLQLSIKDRFTFRAARLPAPLHLLAGLLQASGISIRERYAAIAFMAAMRNARFRLAADTTVAALLATYHQGGGLAKYLWEPLCVATLNTPPAEASARIFLNVLRDGLVGGSEDSNLLLPRVDLSRLFPEAAAEYVRCRGGEVSLLSPVSRIDRNGPRLRVISKDRGYDADAIVCAVGPHQAAELIAPIPELSAARSLIERFSYQPIYTVYLQYAQSVSLPAAMLGLVDGLVQWLFDRQALYGQRGLIAAVMSSSGAHQALRNDAVAAMAAAEVASHFPQFGRPTWSKVIAEKFATYSCIPNLERPQQGAPLKGFYLAGDYTAGEYPATLEAAVQSGVKCAHLIAAELGC